jgi:hypothetical protein
VPTGIEEDSMKRACITLLLLGTLAANPSQATPEFLLRYVNGIPRVEIEGDFRSSRYVVWRAESPQGTFTRVTNGDVLCVGPCFADDYSAVGGRTYWYRFDVTPPDAAPLRYGPYEATISRDRARPISAVVTPNPGRGASQVILFLSGGPGAAVLTDAALFDLQGRRLATIHRGPLTSGLHRIAWNGKADSGAELRTGLYLLRAVAADGRQSITRVVRTR